MKGIRRRAAPASRAAPAWRQQRLKQQGPGQTGGDPSSLLRNRKPSYRGRVSGVRFQAQQNPVGKDGVLLQGCLGLKRYALEILPLLMQLVQTRRLLGAPF